MYIFWSSVHWFFLLIIIIRLRSIDRLNGINHRASSLGISLPLQVGSCPTVFQCASHNLPSSPTNHPNCELNNDLSHLNIMHKCWLRRGKIISIEMQSRRRAPFEAVNKQTDTSHVNDGTTCLPLFEMCRTGGTSMGALCPALIPYARSACTRHRRPPGPRPFSGTSQRNSTLCCAARPAGPARETTNVSGEIGGTTTLLDLACTLPKLPLPSTARKWKSSTVYFLKRGIEVAGAVIRPDRWYWAYVYEVSKYIHNWTH